MACGVERVVDRGVGGEKTLSRALRLESPHLSLSNPDREMRILSTIILAQSAGTMAIETAERTNGRFVRVQPVRDDSFWADARVLQQTFENLDRRRLVAALLNEHVDNLAFVVDSAPQAAA